MMKNYLSLFSFLLIIGFTQAQPPVINSFSPSAAPVGAQVTIQGNHFDINTDSNIVYFGTVRALVNNATNNTLTVTVPAGSSYSFITVKVDTLTAFSRQPFTTSYGSNLQLRSNSFGAPLVIAAARYPCYGDFDNDGRIDMAAITNQLAFFKNTDSAGYPNFQLAAQYATTTSPFSIITADFNADGKLDIAVGGTSSASVWLYSNTSSNGNISFASPVYYLLFSDYFPYTLDANDIDGDGKTDLIISYAHQGTCFSVARNTGTGGTISFAARVNFAFGTVPGGSGNVGDANKIYVADIDGDGKPDVTSLSRFFPPFLIYRNTSSPGTVSFAAKVSITSNRDNTVGNGSFDMKLADIDGDNKPEIIYASSDSMLLSVYKNNSTPGNIAYSSKINFYGPYSPVYVAVNDINGDGKTDVALLTAWDSVYVFENKSQPGAVSFLPKRPYLGSYPSQQINLADLDADGKTDIIVSGTDVNNNNRNKTALLKNVIDETAPLALCPVTDSIILEPGISGTAYQWQVDTGTGFTNLIDDANHSGTASSLLILRNPPSSWTGYQYRCVVDGTNDAAQYLRFTAYWMGSFNYLWENPLNWKCGQLPDENCDVVVNYGVLTLNSNQQVRSITVKPGAIFIVSFDMSLTVSH
jgi:hypothetical protein